MNMSVHVDVPRMNASLKNAAKAFGDTTAQGVARLAVQFAREQAVSTQAFGPGGGKNPKKSQINAIEAGMRAVVIPLEGLRVGRKVVTGVWRGQRVTWPKSRYLPDVKSVHDWVNQRRTRRGARTPKAKSIPVSELGAASAAVFKKAMVERRKLAGIAKGGWLGAGMLAARYQRSRTSGISIGKNFLSYAQKHSHFGRATRQVSETRPTITLYNTAAHVGTRNVLSPKETRKNIIWASRKTLSWYRRAAKKALDKA